MTGPGVTGHLSGVQKTAQPGHLSEDQRPAQAVHPSEGLQPAQTGRLSVRKAVIDDLPQIMDIFDHARKFMKQTGNPTQWGDNYPPEEVVIDDIAVKGHMYVVVGGVGTSAGGTGETGAESADGHIHGVFALIPGRDPTYDIIEDGAWLSDEEYSTIHRVAADGRVNGVFEAALRFSLAQTPHIRIDTHEDNAVMRHLIEKNDFQRTGMIYCRDGSPRIAYERV